MCIRDRFYAVFPHKKDYIYPDDNVGNGNVTNTMYKEFMKLRE